MVANALEPLDMSWEHRQMHYKHDALRVLAAMTLRSNELVSSTPGGCHPALENARIDMGPT